MLQREHSAILLTIKLAFVIKIVYFRGGGGSCLRQVLLYTFGSNSRQGFNNNSITALEWTAGEATLERTEDRGDSIYFPG